MGKVLATPRLIVHVIQAAGIDCQLLGRTAAMVAWLVVYADEINECHHGQVTFDWERQMLYPKFHKKFDRINTDSLLPSSDESA